MIWPTIVLILVEIGAFRLTHCPVICTVTELVSSNQEEADDKLINLDLRDKHSRRVDKSYEADIEIIKRRFEDIKEHCMGRCIKRTLEGVCRDEIEGNTIAISAADLDDFIANALGYDDTIAEDQDYSPDDHDSNDRFAAQAPDTPTDEDVDLSSDLYRT